MKLSITELEEVVRTQALSTNKFIPLTFDIDTHEDASLNSLGDLFQQDRPFIVFHTEIKNSYRVGPSRVSPTRYIGDLFITYLTKQPSTLEDARMLEGIANKFAEETIDGIRFRTYTPYPKSKDNGFTSYSGVIQFDFEIYRGG